MTKAPDDIPETEDSASALPETGEVAPQQSSGVITGNDDADVASVAQDNIKEQSELSMDEISTKFNRVVRKAWLAEFAERLIPKALPPVVATSVFLGASWGGLWGITPDAVKIAASLLYTTALATSPFLFGADKSLFVTRDDALKRIDREIGDTKETPAQTLDDTLVEEYSNEIHKELWNINLKQTWEKWSGKMKAGKIDSGMGLTKPVKGALSALFGVTVALGVFVSSDPVHDVTKAFDWDLQMSTPTEIVASVPAELEIKAWITPPEGITSREVEYFDQDTQDHNHGGKKLIAHEQSVLTIMVKDTAVDITADGQPVELKKKMRTGSIKDPKTTYVYEIPFTDENIEVSIAGGPSWEFIVEQDADPTVEINGIVIGPDGVLIDYTADDDERIRAGQIKMKPAESEQGTQGEQRRPLPSADIPSIPIIK